MSTRILVLLSLAFIALIARAQDDDPALPPERMQEIKAQKAAFLTQRMALTPEEAQRFWPVYNQYDQELETARKTQRDARKEARSKSTLTDAEASKAIDAALDAAQKELDVRKKYTGEFKKLIGAVKTFQLGKAERDFNRELLKRVRDKHEEHDHPRH